MKIRLERILLCLLILTVCFSSPALAGGTKIVREISTSEPNSNSEFTVTLKISGTNVAGIVEYIPEGFSYIESNHPKDQISRLGQSVIFSVIGESEINYQVKGPSAGEGSFKGIWYDPINETEGVIADTDVSFNAEMHVTQSSVDILSSGEKSQKNTEAKSAPFAGLTVSFATIVIAGYYLRRH
jgi:uncharacterized membrane protein